MKTCLRSVLLSSAAFVFLLGVNPELSAQGPSSFGVINTKKCAESSKLGQQEQQNFDKTKSQMETVLKRKGEELREVREKLNDSDYMDSLSDDAASDLRYKKKSLEHDAMELQEEYMRTLQQINMKIIQKLTESMNEAAAAVAKEKGQQIVITDDACSYYDPSLDISEKVVEKMDAKFLAEQKEGAKK